MAAKFKKWLKKKENFDFDGLKLPKSCNELMCYIHCWKAYLIGYNSVLQTFALKCNPDLLEYFFNI